jgi:hypothetical protein
MPTAIWSFAFRRSPQRPTPGHAPGQPSVRNREAPVDKVVIFSASRVGG